MGNFLNTEDNDKLYSKQIPGVNRYKIYKENVYWKGNKVNLADYKSFVDIGYGYGKDDYRVYYDGFLIPEASILSFKVISHGYAKDKKHVYFDGNLLNNIKPFNFCINKKGKIIRK